MEQNNQARDTENVRLCGGVIVSLQVVERIGIPAAEIIRGARACGATRVSIRVTEAVIDFPDDGDFHTHEEGQERCRRIIAAGGHVGDFGWPAGCDGMYLTNWN